MEVSNNECTGLGVVAMITPQYYSKIKKKCLYLFYVHGCFSSMHVCASCGCSAEEATEDTGFLGLELETVVSCHVGAAM